MELNKIKQRLELALKPAKPPTLEEVLKQVSTHGVLRGPVDWVFPAWMLYVEYAVQRIIEMFRLSEEERRQSLHFRDAMKRLLLEAQRQAKEKLTTLYKAVVEGTYRVEGNRLYAPDGVWMDIKNLIPRILIRGVSASARFPDVLKLPQEKLELLQLGWRASDEGYTKSLPVMSTTQPWQIFAWAVVRYGTIYIRVSSINLTHEGISVTIYIEARNWRQKWRKMEAIDLVMNHFKHGEWTPLFTMWLGDGKTERMKILRGEYKLRVVAKDPLRFGSRTEHLIATGKETFMRLREAADVYGELLGLLNAHKWIIVKLATDNTFRIAYKLKTRKRNIDRLRAMCGQNNVETPTKLLSRRSRRRRNSMVVVAGIEMSLHLIYNKGGSLKAEYYTSNVGTALAIAEKLEAAKLRPNIVKTKTNYVVYITTNDILKLAEKDENIRRTVALYLAEKAKNGTPRQREIADKILKRYPFYLLTRLTDN
jgi:hypothetical protein